MAIEDPKGDAIAIFLAVKIYLNIKNLKNIFEEYYFEIF